MLGDRQSSALWRSASRGMTDIIVLHQGGPLTKVSTFHALSALRILIGVQDHE